MIYKALVLRIKTSIKHFGNSENIIIFCIQLHYDLTEEDMNILCVLLTVLSKKNGPFCCQPALLIYFYNNSY